MATPLSERVLEVGARLTSRPSKLLVDTVFGKELEAQVDLFEGMGLADLAHTLAMTEAGARVVMTGRREETLRQASGQLGSTSAYIRHDVTDFPSIPGLVEQVENRFAGAIRTRAQTPAAAALHQADAQPG